MSDTVVYFRGPGPTAGVLPLSDPKFLDDAHAILALTEDSVDAIDRTLRTAEGFVSHSGLKRLLAKIVPDADRAEHAANFIEILDRFYRESQRPLEQFYVLFSKQLDEKCADVLSDAQRKVLVERTQRLISDQASFARRWKAKRLSTVVGRRLEDARIICDLRPVFSPDQGSIDGMIPVMTLKVVATDYDGLPACLEATLSEGQLEELEELVAKARKKLAGLRTLLSTKGLVMPQLGGESSAERDS